MVRRSSMTPQKRLARIAVKEMSRSRKRAAPITKRKSSARTAANRRHYR